MRKLYFFLLSTFFMTASSLGAQDVNYDEALGDLLASDGPGGVAIVVKRGEIVYHKAYGKASIELDVPMKTDNVFRIGSITKQFTASAILKLVEEGKISLDDEITKFLPDYPTQGHKITVHHLLNHTSGIKSYTNLEKWDSQTHRRDFTPQEMVDFFKEEPMEFAPGEKHNYNNSGYFLLGYIIEKASGMTYEEYIETKLFAPLGMKNSYYGHPEEIVANRANGYTPGENGYTNAAYVSMTQPYGAGSLLSTVEDLSTWYHAVVAGKVISEANLAKALEPTVLNDGSTEDYGYGWGIFDVKASKAFGHGGGIHGFLTASTFIPEEGVFVAVFSNCNCNDPGDLAKMLAEMAIGKYEAPTVFFVSDDQLEAYVGKYELGPDFIVTVTKDGDHLIGQATGQGPFPIHASKEHHFINEKFGVEARFNVDASGKVPSFTLFQGGGEMEAKRIE